MANNSLLLRFKMLADTAGLKQGTRTASKDLGVLGKTTDKISKGMKTALAGIGLGLSFSGIVSYLKGAVEGAELARQADARVQQVAKSMNLFGSQLGTVTKRLADYADASELTTGVTAETTKQVQSTLLTFKEIGKTADEAGGMFDRATNAALDLAAAGFGTAEGNAVQLGKALNDPIKGLASLAKSGVTFTAKEKARIKTLVESNKIGKAQKIILEAIENQVGGTAAATALSSDKIKNAFGQISDKLGEQLLPYLDKFAKYLTSKEGQADLKKLSDLLVDALKQAGNLVKFAVDNKDALIVFATAIAGLKVSKGVLDSYNTLKTIWDKLAGLGSKIKAPDVGTPSLPTGGTPTGTVPTGGTKPGGLKFAAPSAAVAVSAAATAAVAVYGSTMVDLYKNDKKKFAKVVTDQIQRAKDYSPGGMYSASEFLMGGAGGTKRGAPVNFGGSNMANITSKDTYNIKIEGSKLTPEQVVALLRKYASKRGKSAGRFVDLG